MQIPLIISYRDVSKTERIESLIHNRCDKLEKMCNYITSCRVAIEKPHKMQRGGKPYRVRLDITIPPGHEIAVEQKASGGDKYMSLEHEIRTAFAEAERQVKQLKEKQRNDRKTHPQQQIQAVVSELFREAGYGFLQTIDTNRKIYFHRNSVLHGDFDTLRTGTGVRFTEEMGEEGPQASTVQIVDQPESL